MEGYGQEEQRAEDIQHNMQDQRQARLDQVVPAVQAPGHEIKDGHSWGLDLQWMAQTIGTEDPNKISGVLADYISIKVALIYNY